MQEALKSMQESITKIIDQEKAWFDLNVRNKFIKSCECGLPCAFECKECPHQVPINYDKKSYDKFMGSPKLRRRGLVS